MYMNLNCLFRAFTVYLLSVMPVSLNSLYGTVCMSLLLLVSDNVYQCKVLIFDICMYTSYFVRSAIFILIIQLLHINIKQTDAIFCYQHIIITLNNILLTCTCFTCSTETVVVMDV